MEPIALRSLSLATILIAVSTFAVRAEEGGAVSPRDLQAKINYCKTCHGINGQGFRGAYPMPRLAGQQTEYLENQLQAFIDRRRTESRYVQCGPRPEPGNAQRPGTRIQGPNTQAFGRRSERTCERRQENLRRGCSRSQYRCLCVLSWSRRQGNGAFPR